MKHSTEETVKQAALAFLKTYYKYRPRSGETVTNFDLMTQKGHIVDGHLTFPKPDGTPFVATFEATSADKAYEVVFTRQQKQLNWDGFSVACLVTMGFIVGAWLSGRWTLASVGLFQTTALILLSLFLITTGFIFVCRRLPRYRRIYAIEQFKQYFADEQWIAISHDVFKNVQDIELLELKQQCVRNGFGLIRVDEAENLEMLITPAREEVFGHRRGAFSFLNQAEQADKEAAANKASPTAVSRMGKVWAKPTQFFRKFTNRFQDKPYSTQMAVSFASCLVLTGLLYTQAQRKEVINLDGNRHYRDSLQQAMRQMQPEDSAYVTYPEYAKGINKGKSTQAYDDTELPRPILENGLQPKNATQTQPQQPALTGNAVGLYVYAAADGVFNAYPCGRVDVSGEQFIVQEGIYPDFASAKARIETLLKQNMFANCISLGCTNAVERGYAVYFDLMFNDRATANTLAINKMKEFEKLNLVHDIKIRKL